MFLYWFHVCFSWERECIENGMRCDAMRCNASLTHLVKYICMVGALDKRYMLSCTHTHKKKTLTLHSPLYMKMHMHQNGLIAFTPTFNWRLIESKCDVNWREFVWIWLMRARFLHSLGNDKNYIHKCVYIGSPLWFMLFFLEIIFHNQPEIHANSCWTHKQYYLCVIIHRKWLNQKKK